MTPLKIRNSTLKLYVLNGILLVTSVFAFCPPQKKSLMTLMTVTLMTGFKGIENENDP